MRSGIKDYLKFFYKVRVVGGARSTLIALFGARVNRDRWDERILLVNLEGMGDIVVLTGVLKHYRGSFPEKKIFLLVREGVGIEKELFGGFVDDIIYADDGRYKKDPFYGLWIVNALRRRGFQTVINQDPTLAEVLGKDIATHLGAQEIVGYEGTGIQFLKPFDKNMAMGIAYVHNKVLARYTKVIPRIDRNADLSKRLPNFLRHYIAIYEGAGGIPQDDYSTELPISADLDRRTRRHLEDLGLAPGSFCLLVLGKSSPQFEWPPERFAAVLNEVRDKGFKVVIAGLPKEGKLRDAFAKKYGGDYVDLIGKLSVTEMAGFIKYSRFVFCNDTGPAHIAVALKKPCLTILGLGHFGQHSFYGHADIHRWAYSRTASCWCDSWQCMHTVPADEPMPCISGIPVEEVAAQLRELLDYLEREPSYPKTPFEIECKNV